MIYLHNIQKFKQAFCFGRLSCLLVLVSFTLGGCVQQGWIAQSDEASWRLKGRVALNTQDQNASFNINWLQEGDSFDIRLSTSLGLSIAHLQGGSPKTKASIEIPKQGRFEADDASELLLTHTGLVMPIEALRYWVVGEAAPALEAVLGESSIDQAGWHIAYLDYKNGLPNKMRLTSPGIRIFLVIYERLYTGERQVE